MFKKRRNKFNNIRISEYDSKLERDYAFDLEALKRAGEIKSYRHHVDYEIRVNGKHICVLEVDFEVIREVRGVEVLEVHEVKSPGTKTAVWRIKHKLFQACYPDVPYFVVQKSQWKSKRSNFKAFKRRVIQVEKE